MGQVVLGILAILLGLLLCFRGYAAMRVLISLWGAFVGFFVGAALGARLAGGAVLGSPASWIGAVVGALLCGLLAYFVYQVGVVLGLAALGFAIGTSLSAALGVSWSWAAALIGVAVGVLLAILAIVGNLPALILILATALAGAGVTVAGVRAVLGQLDLSRLTSGSLNPTQNGWWWTVGYLALAVLGIVVQARRSSRARRTPRQQWQGPAVPAGR